MSIQLYLIKALNKWLGVGWYVRFTSGRNSYPAIEYRCPHCKKQDAWVSGRDGFNGVAPVPTCCKAPVPYPMSDEKFAAHLNAKVRWWNGEQPRTNFIDTWDE